MSAVVRRVRRAGNGLRSTARPPHNRPSAKARAVTRSPSASKRPLSPSPQPRLPTLAAVPQLFPHETTAVRFGSPPRGRAHPATKPISRRDARPPATERRHGFTRAVSPSRRERSSLLQRSGRQGAIRARRPLAVLDMNVPPHNTRPRPLPVGKCFPWGLGSGSRTPAGDDTGGNDGWAAGADMALECSRFAPSFVI